MIISMPDWYTKAQKQLENCIDDIIRENYIDWRFSHDSTSIEDAKETILQILVNISEQVNNPFNPQKSDFDELVKKTGMKSSGSFEKDGRRRPLTEEHIKKIKIGLKKGHIERAYKTNFKIKPNKYPKEMEEFVRFNLNKTTNKQLVELIQDKFGIKTTVQRLSNYMFMRGIKRKKR